jgi:hypothetical protein
MRPPKLTRRLIVRFPKYAAKVIGVLEAGIESNGDDGAFGR